MVEKDVAKGWVCEIIDHSIRDELVASSFWSGIESIHFDKELSELKAVAGKIASDERIHEKELRRIASLYGCILPEMKVISGKVYEKK